MVTTLTAREACVRTELIGMLAERGVPRVLAERVQVMRSEDAINPMWACRFLSERGEQYATVEIDTTPQDIAEALLMRLA